MRASASLVLGDLRRHRRRDGSDRRLRLLVADGGETVGVADFAQQDGWMVYQAAQLPAGNRDVRP